ncbi:hypothetical protein [Paenibacillus pini]|uniref:Uncharacterized protein n=1 Tax=Paenibacillus pini JCM 16418 TaxID=1236976 RepID=W7YBK7_9BACL|nr:hypothetical protein [Paenibacillus pini]GAF08210.1 hypothetical protein JCM16418_2251 [Paenibacillus pini JCM 16418]
MFSKNRSERGSVSVFLIIILAAVFAFVAIFIDYSRIAAMKVQSERLVRAAIRSVMSSYDPELQQKYGLFAFGSSSGDQIMAGVLNASMDKGVRSDAFNLIPLKLDSSSLQMDRMLGEYTIFNREIGEEMKYKAPIDFTLEVMGKFKPLSSPMKEASDAVDELTKLQKLYEKRNGALDAMLAKQRKAAEGADKIPIILMNPQSTYIADESLGNKSVESTADIAAQYNDYVSKYNEDRQRAANEDKLYTDEIKDYLRGSSTLYIGLQYKQRSIQAEHPQLLDEAKQLWEVANNNNEKMKKVIAESNRRPESQGYNQVSVGSVIGAQPDPSGDEAAMIRKIREQTESLVLSEDLLNGLKQEIDNQAQKFNSVINELTSVISAISGYSGTSANASQMKQTIILGRSTVDKYLMTYSTSGPSNKLQQEAQQLNQHRGADKERKQKEQQGEAKLKDAAKILKSINELGEKAKEHLAEYKTLQQYFDENMTFNQQSEAGNYQGADLDNDPYDAGKSAMDNMDEAYGAMGGIMSGFKDEILQNEYAALYFPHFDLSNLTGVTKNPESSVGDALADQLSVNNQELEYILYGFHNPVGNISAAYAEIFAARLAIRTLEGLIEFSKLGNPLLILASALLYGIEMAITDMIMLCEKGSIELSKYMKVQITYRDYLRLFLLLHSNNNKKMSRMLALIRMNTGINPAESPTYASGEVRIGMRLWFLPGVMKAVRYVGSSPDTVEGSRYYATKKADFSY